MVADVIEEVVLDDSPGVADDAPAEDTPGPPPEGLLLATADGLTDGATEINAT